MTFVKDIKRRKIELPEDGRKVEVAGISGVLYNVKSHFALMLYYMSMDGYTTKARDYFNGTARVEKDGLIWHIKPEDWVFIPTEGNTGPLVFTTNRIKDLEEQKHILFVN